MRTQKDVRNDSTQALVKWLTRGLATAEITRVGGYYAVSSCFTQL